VARRKGETHAANHVQGKTAPRDGQGGKHQLRREHHHRQHALGAVGHPAGEKVQIVDINNGARFETYTIEGEADSGVICINGAAARLVQVGDRVIIIAYALMDEAEAKRFRPRVLVLDEENKIVKVKDQEVHGTME
jgi:aspartate 1-decarboxylase